MRGVVVAAVQDVKRRRRAQPQLLDPAGIHDLAVIDDGQLIAELLDLGHVMAAQHHGHSPLGQSFDERAHVARGTWIERAGWLVEHQHSRRPQQCRRQTKPLAHPCRVPRDRDVGTRAQTHLLERLFDACPTLRRGAIIKTGEERQVPPSGQIRIEGGRVDVAGDTLDERIGRGADWRAEQVDRACVRLGSTRA